MNCPTCGDESNPGAQFCRICGSALNNEEAIPGSEQPMVGFSEAIIRGFSNYFNFRGRATRAEFWWWTLFYFAGQLLLQTIESIVTISGTFSFMFWLAVLIPTLAVAARRLHDSNKSGWWQLLLLTIVGYVLVIVWEIRQGVKGENKHGPDPRTTPRS